MKEETYGDISAAYNTYLSIQLDPEIKAVAVGFDPYINYMKVVKAASYIQRPGCIFVGSNTDSFFPTKGDIRLPGRLYSLFLLCHVQVCFTIHQHKVEMLKKFTLNFFLEHDFCVNNYNILSTTENAC